MSFGYALTSDVLPEWDRLDTNLQEALLDAIEDMLKDPPERDDASESDLLLRIVVEKMIVRALLRFRWSDKDQLAYIVKIECETILRRL